MYISATWLTEYYFHICRDTHSTTCIGTHMYIHSTFLVCSKVVCTACVVYPWSNNINPDMDMATPGALGTRMVRIRIIAHRDLRGCKFVAYYCIMYSAVKDGPTLRFGLVLGQH